MKIDLPCTYKYINAKDIARRYQLPVKEIVVLGKYLGVRKIFGRYAWFPLHERRLEKLLNKKYDQTIKWIN